MKLRTSYFNGTVLKKDITRFAPVWGLYSVFLMILLWRPGYFFREMTYPLFIYAGICAVTLFGDLYDQRMNRAMHAFPLRREGWFLTHALAGILFFLVPTCLFSLVRALFSPDIWRYLPATLAYSTLQFLFFFGVALLCVMLAGNRIGAIMLYGILNFLAPVIYWLFSELYQPLLYGIPHDTISRTFFYKLSPVMYIAQSAPGYVVAFSCTIADSSLLWNGNWGYLLICSGVGILLAALALLLYRSRRLEADGNLISVKWLSPVFVSVFSLMFAVAVFCLVGHEAKDYFFLMPYMIMGFFVGRMLHKRRFHVFQLKALLGLAGMLAVVFGSIWAVQTDVFGRVHYVPETKDVASVQVYVDEKDTIGSYAYYVYENFSKEGREVFATEDIAKVTDTHSQLLRNPSEKEPIAMVYLTYKLKSGAKICRYYLIDPASEAFGQLNSAVSTRQAIFGDVDWDTYVNEVYYIRVSPTRGGGANYIFGTPEQTADAASSDIKINKDSMRLDFLNAVDKSCRKGILRQLDYERYDVVVKSRDRWGKERIVSFVIPWPVSRVSKYIDTCRENGRRCPERTITEDTVLQYYP